MADWNSIPEDFGSVEVDYANLHSGNLLAKSDFTDEHKDELVQLGEKLGVSVDSSLELSEMIDSLNNLRLEYGVPDEGYSVQLPSSPEDKVAFKKD